MRTFWNNYKWIAATIVGSAVFALGFSLFLQPNEMNPGGISGLAMVAVELLGFGTTGIFSILINLPLFILGGMKIGKRFFAGSLLGMLLSSVLIDTFAAIPFVDTDPLVAALYGGVLCGLGLGVVFMSGTSTGGSDILVRLLKLKYRNVPIGQISMYFDAFVVIVTGLVFQDVLTHLERTADQCSSIAMMLMSKRNEEILKAHHHYINELHTSADRSYLAEEKMRRAQFLAPLENIPA